MRAKCEAAGPEKPEVYRLLGRGRSCCPEKCVYKRVALKILKILD
jgi:hypothetical protein